MLKRILIPSLCCFVLFVSAATVFPQAQPLSPTETARFFYKSMHDKKFKEAFALTIYKPAIDGLSSKEFEDLRPDFERMAAVFPEKIELSGETISGDLATVFVRVPATAETAEKSEPLSLMKVNGVWIIGDKENGEIVRKAGKSFFFNARIDTHHNDVQDLLNKITLAEVVYSQQHNGQYANMAELITAAMLPKDLEGSETTGYVFHVNCSGDRKSWYATAEPAQYGRSGKLSFYLDAAGVKSGDVGGKPLTVRN